MVDEIDERNDENGTVKCHEYSEYSEPQNSSPLRISPANRYII